MKQTFIKITTINGRRSSVFKEVEPGRVLCLELEISINFIFRLVKNKSLNNDYINKPLLQYTQLSDSQNKYILKLNKLNI